MEEITAARYSLASNKRRGSSSLVSPHIGCNLPQTAPQLPEKRLRIVSYLGRSRNDRKFMCGRRHLFSVCCDHNQVEAPTVWRVSLCSFQPGDCHTVLRQGPRCNDLDNHHCGPINQRV